MNQSSIVRWAIMMLCLSVMACTVTGPGGNRKLSREGEVFARLDQLREQLRKAGSMEPSLASSTESQLLASQTLLGLGDFYFLQGMQFYNAMRADQTDVGNYEHAKQSLQLSVRYYKALKEEWLQAQSTYMLALTNMRAGKPDNTCEFYDRTLSLLSHPRGEIREFAYSKERFTSAQDYVKGVLGEACGIYRAQQAVAKNSR